MSIQITGGSASAPGASETVAGVVELATTTEAATGTDTVRAVTPAGLALRKIGDGWALGSGGNSRGDGAVDLQTVRSNPSQVASGLQAVIGGGKNNTASGPNATVGGGYNNIASFNYATVGGGQGNTATGGHATVGGGYSNNATGSHATVGGGYINTASGANSAILGGNHNDTNSLADAMIVGSNITASLVNALHCNQLVVTQIPVASAGLPSGAVWSDGGTLKIVP